MSASRRVVPEHVEGALELVERWIALVEAGRGNEGLEAALADAEREIAGPPPSARSTR